MIVPFALDDTVCCIIMFIILYMMLYTRPKRLHRLELNWVRLSWLGSAMSGVKIVIDPALAIFIVTACLNLAYMTVGLALGS